MVVHEFGCDAEDAQDPSIDSLTMAREKNHVRLGIYRYMEKLRQEATSDDLDMSIENMKNYIG